MLWSGFCDPTLVELYLTELISGEMNSVDRKVLFVVWISYVVSSVISDVKMIVLRPGELYSVERWLPDFVSNDVVNMFEEGLIDVTIGVLNAEGLKLLNFVLYSVVVVGSVDIYKAVLNAGEPVVENPEELLSVTKDVSLTVDVIPSRVVNLLMGLPFLNGVDSVRLYVIGSVSKGTVELDMSCLVDPIPVELYLNEVSSGEMTSVG